MPHPNPNPSAYAGTTSAAIRPAKPSRYAGVYTGTSPKSVIPDQRGRRFTEWSRREPSDMDGQVARPSERERASQTPYNNSLTSDFSSFSSATDASIFARLKSFIGSALHDFPFSAAHTDRERRDQSFLDAVTSIGTNRDAVPIVRWRVGSKRNNRIDNRIGSRAGGRKSACLDYGGAALLHRSNEIFLQPFLVSDHFVRGTTVNPGVVEIWILSRRVISPDGHVRDRANAYAGLLRELRAGAVFIQSRHGEPAVARNFFRVVHRDQAIGVARISDHKHAHIGRSIF